MKSHLELDVWQQSMQLVTDAYRMTAGLPNDEKFGLTSQIRRCAVSIPANIAEGSGRQGRREYAHHVSIAQGSASELDTLIRVAQQLGYADDSIADALIEQTRSVARMLAGLHRSLTTNH